MNRTHIRRLTLFFIIAAIISMGAIAFADVEVQGRLLDYYPKTGAFDKLKFEVLKVTGGTEQADWIHRGKILVLPLYQKSSEGLYLFDEAFIRIAGLAEGVMITKLQVTEGDRRKLDLPMELVSSIQTDKTEYARGQTVNIRMKVQNTGKHSIALPLSTVRQYDFIVRDAGGQTLWRWSDSRAFIPMLSSMIFARREEKTFTVQWNPTEEGIMPGPGTYHISGVLATEPPYPIGTVKITIK